MRFLHIADLHFGKIVHGVNMLDDQKAWVESFIELTQREQPQAVVIAGDVYDRTQPSDEAVELLDRFITRLAAMNVPVMIVSGNHDSASKLSFGREMLEKQKVFISGSLRRELTRVPLTDEFGTVDFTLLPYMFPAAARAVLQDDSITDYTDAVKHVLDAQNIDRGRRNVLIAHQTVIGGGEEIPFGGSETAIGGVGAVDCGAFEGFDYVALGHIHAAAPVGRASVRYAGTPLCYHFNETRQGKKGALMVEIDGEGAVTTKLLPIEPVHPMREVRGTYAEVLASEQNAPGGCYVGIVITDCKPTPEDYDRLRNIVENRGSRLLLLRDEFNANMSALNSVSAEAVRMQTPAELFTEFFTETYHGAPNAKELELLEEIGEIARNAQGWKKDEAPSEKSVQEVLDFIMKQEANA